MRSNGSACAPCPADLWCDGGRELPCLLPGQCLGNLQGCRAGHAGFLCSSCQPRFYMAPTNFCAPCGAQIWQALAWLGGGAAVASAAALIFHRQLRGVAKGLLQVYRENDTQLSLLWDQLVRLALLNRLSLLALPAEFKAAASFVGLVFSFNTATSATECAAANVGWAFAQKWGLTVGLVFGACAAALCVDLYARHAERAIAVAQWRVWDAMDALLPVAVQACWQAMSSVPVDGEARLLSEPETLFDAYPHYYIYCASVTIVALQILFIFLRFWPALGCENFRTLAHDHERGTFVVLRPEPALLAALRRFHLARRAIDFLRSMTILLQVYGAALAAWWLMGVSTLEMALLAGGWGVLRRDGLEHWDARSTLSLTLVFLFTHAVGVACLAREGGCTDAVWLGAAILLANAALLAWLAARPCRGAAAALCPHAPHDEIAVPLPTLVRSRRGEGRAYVNFCFKLAEPRLNSRRLHPQPAGGGGGHGAAEPAAVRRMPTRAAAAVSAALLARVLEELGEGDELALHDAQWRAELRVFVGVAAAAGARGGGGGEAAAAPRFLALSRSRLLVLAPHPEGLSGVGVCAENYRLEDVGKASFSKRVPGRVTVYVRGGGGGGDDDDTAHTLLPRPFMLNDGAMADAFILALQQRVEALHVDGAAGAAAADSSVGAAALRIMAPPKEAPAKARGDAAGGGGDDPVAPLAPATPACVQPAAVARAEGAAETPAEAPAPAAVRDEC
jgi:hypothetical protein